MPFPILLGICLGLTSLPAHAGIPPSPAVSQRTKTKAKPISDEAIRKLVERIGNLKDVDASAEGTLVKLGARAVPHIIAGLAKPAPDGEPRIILAFILERFGPAAKAPMLKALATGNDNQKLCVGMTFGFMASLLAPHSDEMFPGQKPPQPGSELYKRYGYLHGQDVRQAMRDLLRTHAVEKGAFAAATFFNQMGDKTVVPDLIEATSARNLIVATEAFGALLWILEVKDLPQVRPLFDRIYRAKPESDERPNDRLERLMFVMEEGKDLRGAILIDLLDHPAWEVRHEMLMGLERHPIVSAHLKIDKMANEDPSKVVRRSALLALHKIYPKRSADRIVAYAKSPDPLDRACAAKAIRHDHAPEVEEAVMPLVNDKVAAVRTEIAISLWSSLHPDAENALRRLTKDPDPKVRAAAKTRPGRD